MARGPHLGGVRDAGVAVEVEGLRDLMRDLRRLGDKDAARELRRALRESVQPIAAEASRRAPRSNRDRSGWAYRRHLADTIRPAMRGVSVTIRSPAPHANTVHWGGRHPVDGKNRQKWVQAERRPFILDAIDAHSDRLVDMVGDGLQQAASRNGWR